MDDIQRSGRRFARGALLQYRFYHYSHGRFCVPATGVDFVTDLDAEAQVA